MRYHLALAALTLLASSAVRADTISTISADLTQNSVLPLAPGVSLDLATVMWDAHESTAYALAEPDSLPLSITAVLRAISLEGSLFEATEIVSEQLTPLPWLQAETPIDDRVSLTITPPSLEFPPTAVPDPDMFLVTVVLIVLLGFLCHLRLKRRER